MTKTMTLFLAFLVFISVFVSIFQYKMYDKLLGSLDERLRNLESIIYIIDNEPTIPAKETTIPTNNTVDHEYDCCVDHIYYRCSDWAMIKPMIPMLFN